MVLVDISLVTNDFDHLFFTFSLFFGFFNEESGKIFRMINTDLRVVVPPEEYKGKCDEKNTHCGF